MPNHIDDTPLSTQIQVSGQRIDLKSQNAWARWLNQIVSALFRPTKTVALTFPVTPSGQFSAQVVAFPAGTVKVGDFPVLSAPGPQNGTVYSCYINANDSVAILFHNYSGGPLSLALPEDFSITILTS